MTNSSKEKKATSSRRDWLKNVALLGAVPFVSPLLMGNSERTPTIIMKRVLNPLWLDIQTEMQ